MQMMLRNVGRCFVLSTAAVGLFASSLNAQPSGPPCTELEFAQDHDALHHAFSGFLNGLNPGARKLFEKLITAAGKTPSHAVVHAASELAVIAGAVQTLEAWAAGDKAARNHAAMEAIAEATVALAAVYVGHPEWPILYSIMRYLKSANEAEECREVFIDFAGKYLKDPNLARDGKSYSREKIDYFVNNYVIGPHSTPTLKLLGCMTQDGNTFPDTAKLQTSNPISNLFGTDRIANVGVYQMNIGAIRTMSNVTLNTFADLFDKSPTSELQALKKDMSEFAPKICALYRAQRSRQAPKAFTGLLSMKFNFGAGEAFAFGAVDANGTVAAKKLKDRGAVYMMNCAIPGGLPTAPDKQTGMSCSATAAAGPDFAGWQFQGTVRFVRQEQWEASGNATHPRAGGPVKILLERSGRSLGEVE
jgi:hypothetical protein